MAAGSNDHAFLNKEKGATDLLGIRVDKVLSNRRNPCIYLSRSKRNVGRTNFHQAEWSHGVQTVLRYL